MIWIGNILMAELCFIPNIASSLDPAIFEILLDRECKCYHYFIDLQLSDDFKKKPMKMGQ
jgi:hypothetical protein